MSLDSGFPPGASVNLSGFSIAKSPSSTPPPTASSITKRLALCIAARDEDPVVLADTIKFFVKSNNPPVVVYVVDDTSKDPITLPVFDVPVHVNRNEASVGAGAAKSIAITDALKSSEITHVVVADAHIQVEGDWYSKAEDSLNRDSAAVIYYPIAPWNEGRVPIYRGFVLHNLAFSYGGREGQDNSGVSGPLGGMMILPRAAIADIRGYYPLLCNFGCEEPWITMRLVAGGYHPIFVNSIIKHIYDEDRPSDASSYKTSDFKSKSWFILYNCLVMIEAVFPEYADRYRKLMQKMITDRWSQESIAQANTKIAESESALRWWRSWFKTRREKLFAAGLVHPW